MNDERTMAQLAQEALDVQDACNLSGVVLGWGRSVLRLRALMPAAGTDAINRHPINKLWAAKLYELSGAGLAGIDDGGRYDLAFKQCQDLAK